MKKYLLYTTVSLTIGSFLFSACRKDKKGDAPVPQEQELITTLKLTLEHEGKSATFVYKVENGFGNTSPGTLRADTINVQPGVVYAASVQVLNEKASPVEDITEEILEERNEHLFLYVSDPATGAGALPFSAGSKDGNGAPFNQTGSLTAGTAGHGNLRVYLLHEPANKHGVTPDQAGGETDLYAVFPVRIAEAK